MERTESVKSTFEHLRGESRAPRLAVGCPVQPRKPISEVARVLRPGGSFNFLLNHPLLQTPDSGWIDDHMVEPPEQYWRIGNYLDEAETIEQVESGVHIRFLHRPLSRYLNALADNGLLLERMDEPAPPDRFLAQAPEYFEAASVPRLLHLRLRKVVN